MGLLGIFKSSKLSTPTNRPIPFSGKDGPPGDIHRIVTSKSAGALISSKRLPSAHSSRSSFDRSSDVSPRLSHDELDQLCELILRIGSLIHQLQKERGVSAICVGRETCSEHGTDSSLHHTLNMLKLQTDKSYDELKQVLHVSH